MRLIMSDTAEYPLKRASPAPSGYVGSKNVFTPAGTVTGQLSPASDRFSVEMFGDKAASMHTIICTVGTDIQKNDRVTLTDGEYTVVSVMQYQTHITAALERTGAYGNS